MFLDVLHQRPPTFSWGLSRYGHDDPDATNLPHRAKSEPWLVHPVRPIRLRHLPWHQTNLHCDWIHEHPWDLCAQPIGPQPAGFVLLARHHGMQDQPRTGPYRKIHAPDCAALPAIGQPKDRGAYGSYRWKLGFPAWSRHPHPQRVRQICDQ